MASVHNGGFSTRPPLVQRRKKVTVPKTSQSDLKIQALKIVSAASEYCFRQASDACLDPGSQVVTGNSKLKPPKGPRSRKLFPRFRK